MELGGVSTLSATVSNSRFPEMQPNGYVVEVMLESIVEYSSTNKLGSFLSLITLC